MEDPVMGVDSNNTSGKTSQPTQTPANEKSSQYEADKKRTENMPVGDHDKKTPQPETKSQK